ncbi:helix-turn-helix domain-containing protein [Bacillus cereus]|uniref:helix-turn-helix domain-containing protein n=1 Tax=Bacillus cereus TaxID=1396 RepID=UPI000BF2FA72|nr:helix-turn-helix domain-containing protein [Bacillus cereus]PER14166.1 hypothetical protein CN484_22575 [Bacillus cereus]
MEYIGDNKTRIYFSMAAYDKNQVKGKIIQKTDQIIDFLSVETNAPFCNASTTYKDIVKMQELERQGMSVSKIAIEIGVSRPTIIKYLKKSEESRVQI